MSQYRELKCLANGEFNVSDLNLDCTDAKVMCPPVEVTNSTGCDRPSCGAPIGRDLGGADRLLRQAALRRLREPHPIAASSGFGRRRRGGCGRGGVGRPDGDAESECRFRSAA